MNEKIENCVYQISVNNKQYIGSCKNFNKRISSHKTSSKYLPYQLYEEIDGDWDNSNIKCNCGCSISRHHLARHKRSKKHLKLLENINITI